MEIMYVKRFVQTVLINNEKNFFKMICFFIEHLQNHPGLVLPDRAF
jgi:hypothetical protein